jgi:FkbM family methyltransferase
MSQLIYDVGAHKGEDTEFYLKKGFSVVAIEANPVLFSNLAEKFDQFVKAGKLTLLHVAISDRSGAVTLFVSGQTIWGTTDPAWAKRNERQGIVSKPISVPGERFEDILQRYGMPYFLKVDIEGADMLCLHALRSLPEKPKFLSIESNKASWKQLREEFSVLESLGYKKFKAINQGHVYRQQAPSPPSEGIYAQHRFEHGSSGLFGEETPGRWMSRSEVLAKYFLIFIRYKLFGDNTFGFKAISAASKIFPQFMRLTPSWYDTHAKMG